MKTSPSRRNAYEYAERIRARLPHQLQALREARRLSKYRLEQKSGITREMIGKVERGDAKPSVVLTAQLSYGLGLTLTELTALLEDGR